MDRDNIQSPRDTAKAENRKKDKKTSTRQPALSVCVLVKKRICAHRTTRSSATLRSFFCSELNEIRDEIPRGCGSAFFRRNERPMIRTCELVAPMRSNACTSARLIAIYLGGIGSCQRSDSRHVLSGQSSGG